MRRFFVHTITGCGNLYDILWLGPFGMWLPYMFVAVTVLTGFRLGVLRILECMVAIGNTHIIDIKGEGCAFPEVQDTFVRPTPIVTKICFIFVVPYQPAACFKKTQSGCFEVCQYLGVSTNIQSAVRFKYSGGFFQPAQ